MVLRDPKLIQEKVNEFKSGELPDGSRIGYYRNIGYRNYKRLLNPSASGTVDLILTGSFTRQLFVDDIRPSLFKFDSRDDKSLTLEQKYGKDIWGLSEKRWIDRQKEYSKDLARFIKSKLRL